MAAKAWRHSHFIIFIGFKVCKVIMKSFFKNEIFQMNLFSVKQQRFCQKV